MKQSVGAPGRLASAQSVRTLRRNSAGMAEKTCVSIRRGGVSRYIIFLGSPVAERVDLRGWGWPRRLVLPVIPGWSEGPDPESRDSGFDAFASPRNDGGESVNSPSFRGDAKASTPERRRRERQFAATNFRVSAPAPPASAINRF